jgi:hypothetical protein
MDRGTAQTALHTIGAETQAEDGIPQGVGVYRVEKQALLANVTGPETPKVAAAIIDVEGQADGYARAASPFPGEGLAADHGGPPPDILRLKSRLSVHRRGSD